MTLGKKPRIDTIQLQSMKNLPEEVIVEILLWLPPKCLLRFRSVSKSWLSLISDPHFTRSHFERHSIKHTDNRILHMTSSEVRSKNLSSSLLDDSAVTKLDFPFSESPVPVLIMGSCRGFLLLFDYDSKLSLWNPTTGKSKRIPHSPLWINVFLYGFCYDPSKDDYFIVQASYNPNSSLSVTQIEIFSVKTNSWKNLGPLNCANYINLGNDTGPRAGSVLNGAIHWMALRVDGPDSSNGVIIRFDLAEESLNEVPMPDDFNDKFSYFIDLRVLGGKLSLIDMNCWDATDIWTMGEYGVKSSWMKSMIVSTDEIPGRYFSPICLMEDGEVLGTDCGGELVKCNEIGEMTEYCEYCRDRMGYSAAASIYTESLLSLPTEG